RSRVTVVGPPEAAARLLVAVSDALGAPPLGVTVPRGTTTLLPVALQPAGADDWDWFWTVDAPTRQPGEERVQWLDGVPDDEIKALLVASSPRYSAEPGAPTVVRWCGIRDTAGGLLATAAHTEHVPGVPHLASIATRADARGRGLGRAVTSWLTREVVLSRGWSTLGMYADNEVARRVYYSLGYREEHHFTSGSPRAVENCCDR
ncbi:MAG: GNAT family N-acetyltransferase, partial [Actinomycetota bacterium]|nr:GNAT family N-acetyltransferase [Actinomycetota bacterium]